MVTPKKPQSQHEKPGPKPATTGKIPETPEQAGLQQEKKEQEARQSVAIQRLSLADLPEDVRTGLLAMAHVGNAASLAGTDVLCRKIASRTIDKATISKEEWQQLDQALATVLVYYSDVLAHPIAVWVSTMTMIGIAHAKAITPPPPKKVDAGGDTVSGEAQVREVVPDKGNAGTEAKAAGTAA